MKNNTIRNRALRMSTASESYAMNRFESGNIIFNYDPIDTTWELGVIIIHNHYGTLFSANNQPRGLVVDSHPFIIKEKDLYEIRANKELAEIVITANLNVSDYLSENELVEMFNAKIDNTPFKKENLNRHIGNYLKMESILSLFSRHKKWRAFYSKKSLEEIYGLLISSLSGNFDDENFEITKVPDNIKKIALKDIEIIKSLSK